MKRLVNSTTIFMIEVLP